MSRRSVGYISESVVSSLNEFSNRNVVINGAMQVAQRGTSTASITSPTFGAADRFVIGPITMGTWTQSVEADAPTGSGFRKSSKVLVTTADASPAVGDHVVFTTALEGQNLQQFAKGTASAKQFTLSFWVKSNVTGTYIANLYDNDNTRWCSASYSISASATWEKKTITFPADTTGAFDNDNSASLILHMFLGAGTTYTSGTLATAWNADAFASANIAVGQTNLAATINNYWQITGVQLEVGSVATPFEFEQISDTLAKCQRYYWRGTADAAYNRFGTGGFNSPTTAIIYVQNPVKMRTAPTAVESSTVGVWDYVTVIAVSSIAFDNAGSFASSITANIASGGTTSRPCQFFANNSTSAYIGFSAEL